MLDVTAFEKLDRVIHERGRMAIMSLLAATESLTFKELKEHLKMTDGNLSVHMRTLEESGYVLVSKTFVERKPRTEYALTSEGREAFRTYIEALEEIVQQSQRAEQARPANTKQRALEMGPVLQRGMAPAK
jgi:DNA-binding HxlR family transcriptional regulator